MKAHSVEKAKDNVRGTGRHFCSKSTSALFQRGSKLVCFRTLSSVRQTHIGLRLHHFDGMVAVGDGGRAGRLSLCLEGRVLYRR